MDDVNPADNVRAALAALAALHDQVARTSHKVSILIDTVGALRSEFDRDALPQRCEGSPPSTESLAGARKRERAAVLGRGQPAADT